MVRVYDGAGKPLFEGWYWRFPKRNGYPFFEGKTGEPEYLEGVVRCDEGDWGLENRFILTRVLAVRHDEHAANKRPRADWTAARPLRAAHG